MVRFIQIKIPLNNVMDRLNTLIKELESLNIIQPSYKKNRINPNAERMLYSRERWDLIDEIEHFTSFIDDLQKDKIKLKDKIYVIDRDRFTSVEDVPICSNKHCNKQVLMIAGPYRTLGNFCSRTCSTEYKNEQFTEVDPETGKRPIDQMTQKRVETMKTNGLYHQVSEKLSDYWNQVIGENGQTRASERAKRLAEEREQTIDPETGLTLNQLYGKRAKESNLQLGDDGLTNYQRNGLWLKDFYKTEKGKQLKQQQSYKQRCSLLKKSYAKNLNNPDTKEEYKIYKRRVNYYTNQNDLSLLEQYKKRGNHAYSLDDIYHLDHVFSVVDGFENNIPPFIVGSIVNLQFLYWRDNLKKGAESWIDKDELIDKYYEWINKDGK